MKRKVFILFALVLLVSISIPIKSQARTMYNKRNLQYFRKFTVDIWNDDVCNFAWYYECRTDCYGNEMNPEKALKNWENNLVKAKKWNNVITKLKGKKYKKLKKYWKTYYSEYKKLYKRTKKELPYLLEDDEPNNLGEKKFEKYMWKIYIMDDKYFK